MGRIVEEALVGRFGLPGISEGIFLSSWHAQGGGPEHEKLDFRHFHSFGDEPALGLRFLQLNMLHLSLGLYSFSRSQPLMLQGMWSLRERQQGTSIL